MELPLLPGEPAPLGFIERLGIRPRGVIYAGAYDGELIDHFFGLGFRELCAIEPNGRVFSKLCERRSDAIRCVQIALSDHRGTVPYFHVEPFESFNSNFEPDREMYAADYGEELVASIHVVPTHVECDTLDAVIGERQGRYNALYMNMQGAEGTVLRGAVETLKHLEAIHTEVNFDQRYRGAAMYAEVDRLLSAAGFTQIDLWRDPKGFGMASYVGRRRPTGA